MCRRLILLISFVLVVCLTSNASADLVLHWAFDESAGSTASDSSGNGNPGTLYKMDDTDWVKGHFGNALSFDGDDDYVFTDSALITSVTGDCSIALWLKYSGSNDQALDLAIDENNSGWRRA